ncbi:sulfate adenylyltransferase subunit CysN [Halomonas sp. IOP_14]|uniref:sulfate adenylyltransferase subunit CysN n=1 Tax=Halomonadaceae TaxID=28256 RepID=UPI001594CCDA|nr:MULTISPECIES: sulfate adenylyltransferase subunit CysN [Halomonas]MCD1588722.1 sulfate adenylyltransferase subunit CysN [Halomonas sp. IOP_14]NVE92100.1 sulfate adenylyltransferase subunit CysN [Halomonas titanicae]
MSHSSDLIADDVEGYLKAHEHKDLLLFLTCGSMGDGKSTLISRLLFESKLLFEDPLAATEANSRKYDSQVGEMDLASQVDGLAAEREQGITIDVVYRFFSTEKRKFIVADTPGHEQFTRNMITGASIADTAILMVDARHGISTQTRRHSFLMSIMGMRHVVLAINKMDLVDYSKARFDQIAEEYRAFAKQLGLEDITFIPMSALKGDNVIEHSAKMPWYQGTTLLGYLETVELDVEHLQRSPFRMPVQWVNRPNLDFRGVTGMVASGVVHPGDQIRVQPSGKTSIVSRIYTPDGDLDEAVAGQSITLLLEDEIDISCGDVISGIDQPAHTADQFETTLVGMHEAPLLPGRPYLMKLGAQTVSATVTDIKYQVNVNTLEHTAAKKLPLNSIGVCNLSLNRAVAFDAYKDNHDTGGFILIDRMTNNTVGAGMLHFALRRSQNIHMQYVDIDKQARALAKGQKPTVVWFTGLSGAGKSTIANLVEKILFAHGQHTYLLDGDNVRHGLNRDLGFTDADRVENVRRVAETAKLMVDAGLIVMSAFISPFRSERQLARDLLEEGEFMEIFVDAPLDVVEARDPKGLYKKARRGELKNFTGIDSAYEAPEAPDVHLKTSEMDAEEAADAVIAALRERGMIS